MVARATAPDTIGPESVFPDAADWSFSDGLKGKYSFVTDFILVNSVNIFIRESLSICAFLGRPYLSTYYCRWILLVLPQGTTRSVLSFPYNGVGLTLICLFHSTSMITTSTHEFSRFGICIRTSILSFIGNSLGDLGTVFVMDIVLAI